MPAGGIVPRSVREPADGQRYDYRVGIGVGRGRSLWYGCGSLPPSPSPGPPEPLLVVCENELALYAAPVLKRIDIIPEVW